MTRINQGKELWFTKRAVNKLSFRSFEWELLNCEKCFPGKEKFRDIPRFIKDRAYDVMVVGWAPSLYRTEPGDTFGAKSKNVYANFLRNLGYIRKDVYGTNLIKCTIPRFAHGHVENCIHFLWKEIKMVDPKIVALFGRNVQRSVLKSEYPLAGHIIARSGRTFISLWHPMAVVRGRVSEKAFLTASLKIKSELLRSKGTLTRWMK